MSRDPVSDAARHDHQTNGDGEHRISHLPAEVVRAALHAEGRPCLLLPFGSLEDHGPGMPMGDYRLAETIACRIAARAARNAYPTLVAPAVPFGGADFFTLVPGGITLSPATLRAVVDDIVDGLVRQGVRRIVIVNGHGGSLGPILDATRALRRSHGLVVPTLSIWREAAGLLTQHLGRQQAAARVGHGADPVRSVSLALSPEITRPIAKGSSAAPSSFAGLPISGFGTVKLEGVDIDLPLDFEEIAPARVFAADPTLSDSATGELLIERLVEIGAELIARIAGPSWPQSG